MHRSLRARYIAALLSLACLIVCISPAFAHKINIFAYAEGKTITGSVYFSGGAKAKSLTLTVDEIYEVEGNKGNVGGWMELKILTAGKE